MTESIKTTLFVLAGVIALSAAYFINAGPATVDVQDFVGKYLNDDVDINAPRRLKIVKFDTATASTRQFEVAEVDGVWSIPSKQDYPADATRQMAQAATCLVDRKILRVAGKTAESHEEFGVVDPLSGKLDAKSQGVGTRVVMTDADDKQLVDMVIGKEVKDAKGQYYIRKSNQDVTYVVELDPAKLSTDFSDWIEPDLLKLSGFDIRKVFINDYSADLGFGMNSQGRVVPRISWDRRNEMTVTYDDKDAKWALADIKKFDPQQKAMVADKLADDEEVNQDALNKLRNALDDLKIVDVAKKPAGLSADLKAGKDFLNNDEAFEDLVGKGFSPVPLKPGGDPDILSSEGEDVCTLRDGVEYVLRFGQLQVQTEGGEEKGGEPRAQTAAGDPDEDQAKAEKQADAGAASAKADKDKKAVSGDAANLRRYLFVMARFNKDVIEQPKIKDLPALPAGTSSSTEEKKSDAPNDQPPANAKDNGKSGPPDDSPAAKAQASDAGAKDAGAPASENVDAKPGEKKDDATDSQGKKDAGPASGEPSELEKAIAERKAIETENQRKLDEYQEAIKNGEKKVGDLNKRFGDWYFVISNDVYKQIHLNRADVIVKKKDKAAVGGKPGGAPDGLSGLPEIPAAGK